MPKIKNLTNTKVVINDVGYESANLELDPYEEKDILVSSLDYSYEIQNLVKKGIIEII